MWNVIMNQFGKANPDIKNPLDAVTCANNFKVDANSQPLFVERADPDGVMFNANMSDEKLERYLEIHEWMLSDEARYMQLGFEGTEYKKDANGKIISFNDPETGKPFDVAVKYPATGLLSLVSWRFEDGADLNWPDTNIRADIKQIALDNMAARDPYPLKQNVKLRLLPTPAKDLVMNTDFVNDYSMMIMGKDPVDAAFATFKQNMLAGGLQAAIDEVNVDAGK
jgi:hypothetical protein